MRGYGLYSERWQPLIRPRCGHLLPLGEGCATEIVGLLASLRTVTHLRLPIADCRLPTGTKPSMGARDAEIHCFEQGFLPRGGREQFQSIARHCAIMAGPFNRVFQSAMFAHRRERHFKIAILNFAALQSATPEVALILATATERQNDW